MRTLIYQIPKEVTRVEESYGEIVDKDERVIANYAIDEEGIIIRIAFVHSHDHIFSVILRGTARL